MSAAYEGYDEDELDLMEAGGFIDQLGQECSLSVVMRDHNGATRLSVLLSVGGQEVLIPVPALHSLHGYPWRMAEEVAS